MQNKSKRLRDNGLTGFLCFCIFVPKKHGTTKCSLP